VRRVGNIYPRISELNNLRLAFYKAAKGSNSNKDVIEFRQNLDLNLNLLQLQIVNQQCDIGHYRFFRVRDPKPRHICAAAFPERVLHHAIMNICEPIFESYSIVDSYACRKGKGRIKALKRGQEFVRKNRWYLKMDIRRYFDSVDHSTMFRLLQKRIKDPLVLSLFARLLQTYHATPNKGLPIGNLISQHLSNLYLGHFDHWVKQQKKIRSY
jgi:RNA-directed DNA polymerase